MRSSPKMQLRVAAFAVAAILAAVLPSPADQRGLRIKTSGETLDFYRDSQAIVIGVNDYTHWPKLSNAVSDAQTIGQKLLELGYGVKVITDPDAETLRFTLNQVAWQKGRDPNRALLIYFAGHGATVRLADGSQLGYIVPRDCPLQHVDPIGFDAHAISMRDIEMLALKIQSRHVLMLFDACFSGSLFSLTRAAPAGITAKSLQPVRQFITSGDADEEVPDQSLFLGGFLAALEGQGDYNRDGYLTGSELGLFLQTHVVRYSNGGQHPQYGKIRNPMLDKGDYVFALGSPSQNISKDNPDDLSKGFAQLKMEQDRLLAEKALLEKQQRRMASLNLEAIEPYVRLRSQPSKVDGTMLSGVIKQYGFFEKQINPLGRFQNKIVIRDNEIAIDFRTGLMWHRRGSPRAMDWTRANAYVAEMNQARFGGHNDWRLPTMEELASLLQPAAESPYCHEMMAEEMNRCWSSDSIIASRRNPQPGSWGRRWVVNFKTGQIDEAIWYISGGASFYAGSYARNTDNYVLAVRAAAE